MEKLDCAVQNYAWGKVGQASFVAKLLANRAPVDAEAHYAEFWMGTHANGPTRLDSDGQTLLHYLGQHPDVLGDHEQGKLNFLFKVLSVGQALSIQSHPTKEQAIVLHAKDPKNYPDDNHKPEMAIALTEFELLCGFQRPHGIISNVKAHRELLELIGEPKLDALAAEHAAEEQRMAALRDLFTQVWTSPEDRIRHVIAEIVARLEQSEERAPIDELVLRLQKAYPNDIGVLAPFFLNYFTLQPGEATFLGPNEPHAYLFGDCIECMALSDNTIRAGLTPKFKDVQTLFSSLTYRMVEPPYFRPQRLPDGIVEYAPPVNEFAVHKIDHSVGALPALGAGSILVVVSGTGTLQVDDASTQMAVGLGDAFFIAASASAQLNGTSDDFLAFRAFSPIPKKV